MEIMVYPGSNLPEPGKCARCANGIIDCVDLGFDIEEDVYAVTERTIGRKAALYCMNCVQELINVVRIEPQQAPVGDNEHVAKLVGVIDEFIGNYYDVFDGIVVPESGVERLFDIQNDQSEERVSSDPIESDELDSSERSDDLSSDRSDGDSEESLSLFD